MSEQIVTLLKRQAELNKICGEIVGRDIKQFSSREVEYLSDLEKEFQANHKTLVGLGPIDHDYFNKKRYEQILNAFQQIQERVAESSSVSKEEHKHPILEEKIQKLREYLDETYVEIQTQKRETLRIRKNKIHFLWQNISDLRSKIGACSLTFEAALNELEFDIQNISSEINEQIKEKVVEKIEGTNNIPDLPTLPNIEVPTFGGDSKEWDIFHELFMELIHSRESLSSSLKFNYLKSALKGEARNVVAHLLMGTAENYEAAWDLLTKRYENRRKIFSEQLNRLMDLSNLNIDSVKQIKSFIDTINEAIHILKLKANLSDEVDVLFAHMVLRKFNTQALQLYESHIKKTKDIQNLSDVMEFLEQRLSSTCSVQAEKPVHKYINSSKYVNYSSRNNFANGHEKCPICKIVGHIITQCHKFKGMNPTERLEIVRKVQLCTKCLKHFSGIRCTSEYSCSLCNKGHHTMLHINSQKREKVNTCVTSTQALLATARIKVKSANGDFENLRALIDSGSQSTIISEEAAQILKLPRIKSKTEISGISCSDTCVSKYKIKLSINDPTLKKQLKTEAIILPKLMKALPINEINVDKSKWQNFALADPDFNKPGRVDVIIGADLYTHILKKGIAKINGLLCQNTNFGWIVSGCTKSKGTHSIVATTIEVQDLERFWELEKEDKTDVEAEICENNFIKTTTKDPGGRYIVKIPFKDDKSLGESKPQAMARFMNLEKKFQRNERLKENYTKFIKEYIDLGHMAESKIEGKYYLPHQAVLRDSSLTTKLRVVFDASAKTTNNRSLNDIMWVGPRVQKEIFNIILNWRKWEYVISADIEKMYRQIFVDEKDQEYQYILWRDAPNDRIKSYKLKTVTYGTASAPYLATRVLVDIADRCKNKEIGEIIRSDFYMDDLMTGANSIEEAINIIKQISSEFMSVNLNLRKWISNKQEILKVVEETGENKIIYIEDNEFVKTLGLQWEPQRDEFKFSVNIAATKKENKRTVLSTLSKIYDPLGWLAPVTITGKLFVQKLWLSEKSWDQELSEEDAHEWASYKEKLSLLETIRIPRWIQSNLNSSIELHGFADASEKAYAAIVYAKVGNSVIILASKSRVNPIKNRKTIPKLELCAAHLLNKLIQKIKESINDAVKIYAWSDSTITLAWIKSGQSKVKFIKRRTDDIRKSTEIEWNHVRSEDNPADAASRGIPSSELIKFDLWWKGPKWLASPKELWPRQQSIEETVLVNTIINDETNDPIYNLIERYSSVEKLIRIVAYINRFVQIKTKNKAYPSTISVKEIKIAEKVVIKKQQEYQFRKEIKCLKSNKEIKTDNKILSLNPFLDKDGILRVGGRLQNSNAEFEVKHPIILEKCYLTNLLIKNAHSETLHGGINLMRNYIQRKYWIFGLKNALKKYLRECVKCARYRQYTAQQIMGNLPKYRVTMSFPFLNTGIDYAGPYFVKCSKNRGQKTFKGYVAVFVCMATKAIHLEMVSDLTSDAFLAALRRFIARRGKCANIYSDNGTNFVGAARKLDRELVDAIQENLAIAAQLEKDRIDWHFIPPAGPHFGGIWEAGVKSMKYHLKRIIGDNILTYEEMSTLLCQIEACLNSRPLYTLVNEMDQQEVLTPGHFLIGRPPLGIVEPMEDEKIGNLDRWRLIQKMKKDFWVKWKNEYLHTLQQRNKWKKEIPNIEEGQIVLLKDENCHPARWPLGKVEKVHKGNDDKVRVAKVKMQEGYITRPITKICPLEGIKSVDKNEADPEPKRRTRATSGMSKIGIFMAMLLFVLSCQFSSALPKNITPRYSIDKINKTSAIYLDPLGDVEIVSTSWNLVIYYKMDPYFKMITKGNALIRSMRKVCERLHSFEEQCSLVLDNMQSQLSELEENNKLFMMQSRSRSKRAPFEFMGSLYHILFGIMDEDDREQLEENMKSLLDNQNNLDKLIQKQTSVVDSTSNLLKRTTEDVNANFRSMQIRIENMTEVLKENYYVYKESIKFFMVTRQLHSLIEEGEKIQTGIISLLIDINHGRINTNILRPNQLKKEIAHIQQSLSENLVIPGKRSGTELKEVYTLLTARGLFIDDKLIISAKVPLFSRHPSKLFRLIPVPIQNEDQMIMVHTTSEYLIYNFEIDSYHIMAEATLNQCQKWQLNKRICKGSWPWNSANDNACEMQPLKPNRAANCIYKTVVDSKSYWVELEKKSSWLFKVPVNSKVRLQCAGAQIELFDLPQQGVLSIAPYCTARTDDKILVAHHNIQSESEGSLSTPYIGEVSEVPKIIWDPLKVSIINHTEEFKRLNNEIKFMKEHHQKLKDLDFHHISGHAGLIIALIIMVVLIIYFIKRCAIQQRMQAITFAGPLSAL